jgi:O-antigen/teichoic acid export membrane protein
MRRFLQVLSADFLAKAVLGLVAVALIRYLDPQVYATYLFGVAAATVAAQTLAASFNRIYIVGYERLALARRAAPFLGMQLAWIGAAAAVGALWRQHFGGAYGAAVLLAFAKTFYQQQLRFRRYSAIEIARALMQAAGIAALLAVFSRQIRAEAILQVQAFALLAASVLALSSSIAWPGVFSVGEWKRLSRQIVVGRYGTLLAYFALLAVFSQIDVFMLKLLAAPVVLAAYGAAARYYALLSLALGAVHAVLLPSVQAARGAEQMQALYRRHLTLVLIFAPTVAALAVGSGWLLPWIDGGRYPDSIPAFRILALSSVVSFACSPHVNLLLKLERFDFLLKLLVLASAAALALHGSLIPRYGAVGAAVATLIASAMVTMPIFATARREGRGGGG